MQIKASIIIPVFNVEQYLEECLISALKQDYNNKEIIVIDDGSTDSSSEIIERYQAKYPLIKTVKTKNQGLSAARNLGLEMASGDYILFLDSDDWINEHTLTVCIEKIKQYNLDIVLFNASAFLDGEPNKAIDLDSLYTRSEILNNHVMTSTDYFIKELELNNYLVQACIYMFNRAKYANLKFYPGILHEDNLFTTQLLLQYSDAKVMSLPNRLFHRRFRADSIMTQNKQQRHIDGYFVVIDELIKILPHHKNEENKALKLFITKVLFEILLILNPVYGWSIPLKVRLKILYVYFNCGLLPFKPKLFVKFLIPASFSYWHKLKHNGR